MKISYAITVCNELEEITKLVDFLSTKINKDDEIVIQYDSENVTPEVLDYLNIQKMIHNHTIVGYHLNKDFASFKNNLKSYCTGDYIFQIDADEIPNEILIDYLPQLLTDNPVDIIFVPRVNTVEGLTEEHIQKWRWNVNDKGWVNWPDYQTRIYKNTNEITWMNKVHERITGYDTFSNFPSEENWCLYHHKQINRQEKQNEFYGTI
jgi:glycosyltransferase involved in cell wall biosynthesis